MRIRNFWRFIGLALWLTSLGIFAWGVWPSSRASRTVAIAPDGRYQLTMSWPSRIRLGDEGRARLSILQETEPPPTSALTNEQMSGAQLAGGLDALFVEARLEVAGMLTAPPGEISQPLLPDGRVIFFWSLRPMESGAFEAVVWVSVVEPTSLVDEAGIQPAQGRRLLTAQRLPIAVDDLFGLPGALARLLGGFGAALGVVLGGMAHILRRKEMKVLHA